MAIEAAFLGMLSRDAEVKTSKNGKTYFRANIRIGDGAAVQWINASVFDTDAIQIIDKMVKGACVYVEGKLSLDEWTAQDGAKRHGLSVVSWHCRLAQIGRNKVKRDKPASGEGRGDYAPAGGTADLNDDVPFAPEFR